AIIRASKTPGKEAPGEISRFRPPVPAEFEAFALLLHPVIEMAPGELRRLRFVDAGLAESLPLSLVKLDDHEQITERVAMFEIAVDGLPLGRMSPKDTVE